VCVCACVGMCCVGAVCVSADCMRVRVRERGGVCVCTCVVYVCVIVYVNVICGGVVARAEDANARLEQVRVRIGV